MRAIVAIKLLFSSLFVICGADVGSENAIEEVLATLKRPECAATVENSVYGGDYNRYFVRTDEQNVDAEYTNDVNVVNLDQGQINMNDLLRGLPNETFLSIVSWI